MKKYCFIPLILFALLCSCKKKISENGTSQTNEFSANDYKQGYGLLEVMKVEELVSGNLYPHGSSPSLAHSYFYDSLSEYNYMGANGKDVGTVSLNGTQFKKYSWFNSSLSIMYFDTVKSVFSFPLNWKITGNNNFNPYNIQISGDYPTFSGYSSLPDTIFFSNGVTIPLVNISGDQIQIYIDDGSTTYTNFKFLEKPFTNVSFTSSDFVPFMNSNNGNITIVVYKNNLRTLNNHVYNFRTGYQLIKRNVVLMY